jgi:phage-related protein
MILKTGKDIVTDLTRTIGRVIGFTSQKAKPLLSMVLEFTSKLSYVGQEIEYLYRVFKTVIVYTNEYFKITSRIADGVIFVLSSIASVAGVAFGMAAAGIVAAVNVVYKAARKVYKFLEPYISRVRKELEKHQDIIDKITGKVRSLWKVVTNAIASPDELLRKVNAGLLAGASIAKKSIIATIGTIRKVASDAAGFFKPFTSTIGAELKKHGDILDAFVDKIRKIPSAITKIPSSISGMFKKLTDGLVVSADAAERGTNELTDANNRSFKVAVINDKNRAKSSKNLAKTLIANNARS